MLSNIPSKFRSIYGIIVKAINVFSLFEEKISRLGKGIKK